MEMNENQKFHEEKIRERVKKVVNGLHKIANDIERSSSEENLFRMVEDVQHTIFWGVANLHIDGLTSDLNMLYEFKDKE